MPVAYSAPMKAPMLVPPTRSMTTPAEVQLLQHPEVRERARAPAYSNPLPVVYLHRWPSQRAMKPLRAKVKARTGRNRAGTDVRLVIQELNPILRGWGNYFRTGNAATKFHQVDWYVVGRLRSLMVKKRGRNLRAGQAARWDEDWFNGQGLYRLRGTIRHPKAAYHVKKIIGKPYAGKPHVRIERGWGNRAAERYRRP